MASANSQTTVTLHRRVKDLAYNAQTQQWDIIFIDAHGNEHPGKLPHSPRIGMNFLLALQVITVNYCINNQDEANLWLPNSSVEDLFIDEVGTDGDELFMYDLRFENGIRYKFVSPHNFTVYELIERLCMFGISYFIDATEQFSVVPEFYTMEDNGQDGKVISIFNNEKLRTIVTVQDNANQDVTDEQIKRVFSSVLKVTMMLYGMFSTGIKAMNYSSARFTNCSDLSIPAFDIDYQLGMIPEIIVFDELTYIIHDKDNNLVLSVNE